jgi:hypothetical protein
MEPKEPRTFRVTTIHPDRREEVVSDAEMAARAERKFFHSVTQVKRTHTRSANVTIGRVAEESVAKWFKQHGFNGPGVPGEEMDQA